jgi:hypothetical protein
MVANKIKQMNQFAIISLLLFLFVTFTNMKLYGQNQKGINVFGLEEIKIDVNIEKTLNIAPVDSLNKKEYIFIPNCLYYKTLKVHTEEKNREYNFVIKDIFLAHNDNKKVKKIFLYLEGDFKSIVNYLNSICKSEPSTGISNQKSGKMFFWSLGDTIQISLADFSNLYSKIDNIVVAEIASFKHDETTFNFNIMRKPLLQY